jgi:hypothetical protein
MKLLAEILCAMFLALAAADVNAGPLVTEEEARLPNATGTAASRAVTRGPGIKLVSPDPASKTVKSPFDLKLIFEPRGGSKIDPASVKLYYMKNPLVDLTDRVKGGIKGDGIDLSKVEMPAGEHPLRVTVNDDEGRSSSSLITVIVVK